MNLSALFRPQSVAIVGISSDPNKIGSIIANNLKGAGFAGHCWGVNPKHADEDILGTPCFASVSQIGHVPDLVVIAVPADRVEAIIDDCIIAKAQSIIIISAGFAEVGNKELQLRIAQKCFDHHIALLGPNRLGVIFPHARVNLSFADGQARAGNICVISQSWAFCTAILDWAYERRIGFSHLLSLGNKACLDESDILEYLANDDTVQVFVLYLENVKNGSRLLRVLESITPYKTVLILEPGRSHKAALASSSHTGSMAPNFRVVQTAYAQVGALQVYSFRQMFHTIELLEQRQHRPVWSRIGLITNAGGIGVASADMLDDAKLELVGLSEATRHELTQGLPESASVSNPIDLIGDARADRYAHAIRVCESAPEIEEILVLLTPQKTTEVIQTAQIIREAHERGVKPITACFLGGARVEPGIMYMKVHHVPHFAFPADAIEVLGLLAGHRTNNYLPEDDSRLPKGRIHLSEEKRIELTHKIRVEKMLGHKSLTPQIVREIWQLYDLALPVEHLAHARAEAMQFFTDHQLTRCVAKIASAELIHKTEVKGIRLNLTSAKEVGEAYDMLMSLAKHAGLAQADILIQEQLTDCTEVIAGVHTDPTFGRILLFGAGGVYTEVLADNAISLLPSKDLKKVVLSTRISEVIRGIRGEEKRSLESLLHTLNKIEQIALDFAEIASIDCNPILVAVDRSVCVDIKMIL